MTTSIIVFLAFILVGVAAATMVLQSNKQKLRKGRNTGENTPSSSQESPSNPRNPYQATAILPGENSCDAVRSISGTRFPDAEKRIPQIPLANCDIPKCSCKYEHYVDRRNTAEIRRAPPGLKSQLHPHIENVERRLKRGRRTSDWD